VKLAIELTNAMQEFVGHPILNEPIGRKQANDPFRLLFDAERPNPGFELLGWKLVLQVPQTLPPYCFAQCRLPRQWWLLVAYLLVLQSVVVAPALIHNGNAGLSKSSKIKLFIFSRLKIKCAAARLP